MITLGVLAQARRRAGAQARRRAAPTLPVGNARFDGWRRHQLRA